MKQTLLGPQDILQGDIQLNLRDTYTSTIQKGDVEKPLLFHDNRLYVEALLLPTGLQVELPIVALLAESIVSQYYNSLLHHWRQRST